MLEDSKIKRIVKTSMKQNKDSALELKYKKLKRDANVRKLIVLKSTVSVITQDNFVGFFVDVRIVLTLLGIRNKKEFE